MSTDLALCLAWPLGEVEGLKHGLDLSNIYLCYKKKGKEPPEPLQPLMALQHEEVCFWDEGQFHSRALRGMLGESVRRRHPDVSLAFVERCIYNYYPDEYLDSWFNMYISLDDFERLKRLMGDPYSPKVWEVLQALKQDTYDFHPESNWEEIERLKSEKVMSIHDIKIVVPCHDASEAVLAMEATMETLEHARLEDRELWCKYCDGRWDEMLRVCRVALERGWWLYSIASY